MKTFVLAILGVAGLSATASAQVNWETRIGFAPSLTAPLLAGNQFQLTATGVYTFVVRAGIFNLTGLGPLESNQGLFDWTATASATGLNPAETLGANTATSRIVPFTFGPATAFAGTIGSGGASITSIDAARDVSGAAQAQWLWDTATSQPAPMPTAPTNSPLGNFAPTGINSYANVWRFSVLVNSLNGNDITVSFAGQAGPITRWVVFGWQPPDEGQGSVSFMGLTPQPILREYSPVAMTLVRTPSPGGLALLGLACGLALARRRGRDWPS